MGVSSLGMGLLEAEGAAADEDEDEVPQVLFRLSRWENLEHAEEV